MQQAKKKIEETFLKALWNYKDNFRNTIYIVSLLFEIRKKKFQEYKIKYYHRKEQVKTIINIRASLVNKTKKIESKTYLI